MRNITKSYYAALAMMRSLPWKPSSEPEALEVRIAKVRLEPGDTLVITTEKRLTIEQCQHIRATVANALPDAKAMVLHGGLQLSVLSQEAGGGSKV